MSEVRNHYKVKQVIVLRGDLNYHSKGKMCAMAAHLSLKVIADRLEQSDSMQEVDGVLYEAVLTEAMHEWFRGAFAKIVVKCESLDDVFALEHKAIDMNIPYAIVKDNATTCFDEPTIVGIALGPDYSDRIDQISGGLKLL